MADNKKKSGNMSKSHQQEAQSLEQNESFNYSSSEQASFSGGSTSIQQNGSSHAGHGSDTDLSHGDGVVSASRNYGSSASDGTETFGESYSRDDSVSTGVSESESHQSGNAHSSHGSDTDLSHGDGVVSASRSHGSSASDGTETFGVSYSRDGSVFTAVSESESHQSGNAHSSHGSVTDLSHGDGVVSASRSYGSSVSHGTETIGESYSRDGSVFTAVSESESHQAGITHSSHGSVTDLSHGDGAVSAAVRDHISQAHGVSGATAEMTGTVVGQSVSDMAESFGRSASVNFHNEGPVAVSVGESLSASEGSSVSIGTLMDIHEHGMPQAGIDTLRENLGSEISGLSDLQVVDTFGHDLTHAVGEQGYPEQAVNDLQQSMGGSSVEALQALGHMSQEQEMTGESTSDHSTEQPGGAEMEMSGGY